MTVATTEYTVEGAVPVLGVHIACNFPVHAAADLRIVLSNGALAVLNVDYTVQLDEPTYEEASVIPLAGLVSKAAGLPITIKRRTPATNETSVFTNNKLDERKIDREFDRSAMRDAELRGESDGAGLAAERAEAAATLAEAARDDVRQRWLGGFDYFPEDVDVGFVIEDGAGAYIHNQPDPDNDGVYVRVGGLWERVGAVGLTGLVSTETVFATAGQTVVNVPSGYTPGQVEVYRNGRIQKIGPSPGTGLQDNDCTADDGATVVFPAATLLLNDWLMFRRTKAFDIAEIAAVDVSLAAIAGMTATNVQAGVAELHGAKAPLASPALTGAPTAPDPTGGAAGRIATKGYVDGQLQPGSVLVASGVLVAPASSIDVALTGGYQEYELVVDQYEQVTSAQGTIFRVATDGVPTFISGASTYEQAGFYRESNGTLTDNSGAALTSNVFGTNLAGVGSGHAGKIVVRLSQGAASKRAFWQARSTFIQSGTGRLTQCVADGALVGFGALTHARVIPNSGNIATGARWRLYGLRN